MLLNQGVQFRLFDESPTQAGSLNKDVGIQSEAVLVTLSAPVVAGTLDVSVYGSTDDGSGEEALLFTFPQLSSAVAGLLLRRSSVSPARIRVKVSYSDACTYRIHVRAVSAGSSDVRILGSSEFETSRVIVNTGNMVLIPSALVDRAGVVIKNWSTTQTVYIAESSAKLTSGDGYPLGPRDALAMDVNAGASIWAVADSAGADVRLIQAGGV